MTPDRFRRICELFNAALDASSGERASYLDASCGDDKDLRREVEKMLAAHDEERDDDSNLGLNERLAPFRIAAADVLAADVPTLEPSAKEAPAGYDRLKQIGPYRIIRTIGAGGMGIVYEAEQQQPKRSVAVKVIRPDVDVEKLLRRFELEAEMLGRLNHPGIAQILEAGQFESDHGATPYFAMELIDGTPLRQFVRDSEFTQRERIELLEKIALAVAHAHENAIVHRDLKPENVLVELNGQPKILDFGVAHVADPELRGSFQTTEGQIIGTLAYMSPEQIATNQGVDARSDVYSLGVMAYELLAARPPFDIEGLSLPSAARRLVEMDPPRLGSIDRSLQGDLETIVNRALEKEPDRRYATAADFAADLRRYLDDEPITARPTTNLYRIRKFARRNSVMVTSSLIVALVILVGSVASIKFWNDANEQTKRSDKNVAAAVHERTISERRRDRAAVLAAELFTVNEEFERSNLELEKVPLGARNWEWNYVASRNPSRFVRTAHQSAISELTFGPNDARLVSIDQEGHASLWEPLDGRLVKTFEAQRGSLIFHEDGAAFAYVQPNGHAVIRETSSGGVIGLTSDRSGTVSALAFLPGTETLIAGTNEGSIYRFQMSRPEQLSQLLKRPAGINALSVSSNGKIAVRFADGVVQILDAKSGAVFVERDFGHPPTSRIEWVAAEKRLLLQGRVLLDPTNLKEIQRIEHGNRPRVISEDGSTLAAPLASNSIAVYELTSGRRLTVSQKKTSRVRNLAFSKNGHSLFAATGELGVVHYDVKDLSAAKLGELHTSTVSALAVSGHGRWLASGSTSGAIALWELSVLREERDRGTVYDGPEPIFSVTFSADGERIYTAGRDLSLRAWCARLRRPLAAYRRQRGDLLSVAVSPISHLVATGSTDGTVCVRHELSGRELAPAIVHGGLVPAIAFDQSSTRLITACSDGKIRILSTEDLGGSPQVILEADSKRPSTSGWTALSVSGDLSGRGQGARIVASRDMVEGDSEIWMWTRGSLGEWSHERLESTANVRALAFSPNGHSIAHAGKSPGLTLHDGLAESPRRRFVALHSAAHSIAFHRDGSRVAVSLVDGSIVVVDVRHGEEVLRIPAHDHEALGIAWSPTGDRLASVSKDGVLRIWESANLRDRVDRLRAFKDNEPRSLEWLRAKIAATAEPKQGASHLSTAELVERLVLDPGADLASIERSVHIAAGIRFLQSERSPPQRDSLLSGIDLAAVVVDRSEKPTTGGQVIGVSVDEGRFLTKAPKKQQRARYGTNPQPVEDSPLIDSVFFLNSPIQPINSSAVPFLFHPGDESSKASGVIQARVPASKYPPYSFGQVGTVPVGIAVNRSQGITFDLDAIREFHGEEKVRFFSTIAGEVVAPKKVGGIVNAWIILSNETEIIESMLLYRLSDEGVFVQTPIPTEARFLTLAGGAAMNGNRDRCVFGVPQITARSLNTTEFNELEVLPHWIPLPFVGTRFPIRVVGRRKDGPYSGLPAAVDVREVRYESSNPAVAHVDKLGVVTAITPGTATIRVTLGGFEDEVRVVVE